jgi:hypothetical protein
MHRAAIIAPILMAASTGCATAHARPSSKAPAHQGAESSSPKPAPTTDKGVVDEAPYVVDYRVVDGNGEVILGGQTALEPPRPVTVDRRLPGSPDATTLSLQASRTPTQDVVVTVQYEEQTERGGRLSWTPRVAIRRGSSAEASIAFADGGRRNITLSVK